MAWYKNPITVIISLGLFLSAAYIGYSQFQRHNQPAGLNAVSNLPRPSAVIPPPATFLMQAEPNPEILGIRRLKVMRPEFLQNDNDKTSSKDFYLVGTKSAELIRQAVDNNIKPFPEIKLQDAVQGALAADEWGFELVQSYVNISLGDEEKTKERIDELLAAIESRAKDYDRQTIADAVNLVIEAGARTYWSAFMAPVVIDKAFRLKEGAIGFDFGPADKSPYADFRRVTPGSDLIEGRGIRSVERAKHQSIVNDGIRNIDQFVATGLKDGLYRVVILTGRLPGDEELQYPFGVNMEQNGAKLNMVDTRSTANLVPVMRLATEGPGRVADVDMLPEVGQEQAASNATGQMIVTRAEVRDGVLRLNFRAMGATNTYITSVILYPEEEPEFIDDLNEEVQQMLDRIAPAAGTGEGDSTQPLVISPDTAFQDNAGGLPTNEANNATPNAGNTNTGGTGNTNTGTDTGSGPDIGSQDGSGTDTGGGDPTTGGDLTLVADAGGPYAAIPLGEDFTVDGCGSSLNGVSACSLTNTGAVELVWLLDGEEIGTGDTLVVQTGEGTPFNLTGEYEITLELRYTGEGIGPDGLTITLEDGTTIFLPGDLSLVSIDTAVIQIIAPIPEPETIALLMTALLMVGWMHRRRRRNELQTEKIPI